MWTFIHRTASPKWFYRWSGFCLPWLLVIASILFIYGLYGGLVLAPADYQQGDSFRIMYIHVPCAFLSMAVYMLMAVCSLIFLVWKMKLADMVAAAAAPLGAWFTFLALVTGSIWGRPTWGTWWIWDARLTSELILLFLYFGYMALRSALPDPLQAARAAALIALVGVVNIPIIHYSVVWWNSLHQGSSLSLLHKPTIAGPMLYPLLAMLAAFFCYFVLVLFVRVRHTILQREQHTQWVKELANA